jgi:hypothetical protein
MRVPWKVLGLAGVAGVAATGVVVARKRRAHTEYDPDELRERLHERLGEVPGGDAAAEPDADADAPAADPDAPAADPDAAAADGDAAAEA